MFGVLICRLSSYTEVADVTKGSATQQIHILKVDFSQIKSTGPTWVLILILDLLIYIVVQAFTPPIGVFNSRPSVPTFKNKYGQKSV